jgi:pyruvate dehydrogenase E2 component (dihydrolipoamide acetyltransferase)
MATRKLHGWRKLAGAFWGPPNDPQFYGDLEIDAGTLLEHLHEVRQRTGVRVTVTHAVGRAVAHGLTAVPELRVRRAYGREHPRDTTDVFFIIAGEEGELTGCKVERADEKSLVEIAEGLEACREVLASGSDEAFGRAKRMLDVLPPRVLSAVIRLSAWLTSDLDLDLPALGVRRQAFGGAMITSVGMWGITRAYSPLASYYRVPVLVLVGAVVHKPVAVAGQVVVRPILTLTATFDHRYADGAQAARFAAAVKDALTDPELLRRPAVRRESAAG